MSEGTADGSNMLTVVDRRCMLGGVAACAATAAARAGVIKFSLVCDRRGAEKSREVEVDMSGIFWSPAALLRRHPPKLYDEPPREGDEKPGDGGGLPSNDVDEPLRAAAPLPLPLPMLLLPSPSLPEPEPFRVSGAENKLEDGRLSTGAVGPEFLQLVAKSASRLPRRCTGA